MKLFYVAGFCSLAPHIVAREAGVAVELVRVDLRTQRTADGRDYAAINPPGYVPALQLDDGTVLTEVSAVVQYLADLRRLTELESHFAVNAYLMGDTFTVADSYAFVVLTWCENEQVALAPFPNVRAFMERVRLRPHVQAAMRAEGLKV